MTIEQLFGTLQQSIVDMWQAHLKTDQHDIHVVLDDYYKDMPELIDTLIENYMGRYGKVLSYENVLNPGNYSTPQDYLVALRNLVDETRKTITASELQSDIDAILSFIDSTVYKLKELCVEGLDVTFTLEEGTGKELASLAEVTEAIRGKKNLKPGHYKGFREEDEEEKIHEGEGCKGCGGKKKKHLKDRFDKEEECEMKEGYVSLRDYILEKSK